MAHNVMLLVPELLVGNVNVETLAEGRLLAGLDVTNLTFLKPGLPSVSMS